jgi:hypothetical protein
MKIVNRKTFLTLPAGTVYLQAFEPWVWEDIKVKGDTLHTEGAGDWVELDLTYFENDGSTQYFDRLDEMKDSGASYPLDLETTGRDGMFEMRSLFMIYERTDVEKLRDLFASLVERAPA